MYFIAILFIAVFIYFCIKHAHLQKKIVFYTNLSNINDEYIARIDRDFSKLIDKGTKFEIPTHDYCIDLDIFGEESIYALFNISETSIGREKFADTLLNSHISNMPLESLITKQATISKLAKDPVFLQEYQAIARNGKSKKGFASIVKLASENNNKPNNLYRIIPIICLSLWIIPLILMLIGSKFVTASALAVFAVNLCISFAFANKICSYFKAVEGINKQSISLAELFDKLESITIEDDYLHSLIFSSRSSDNSPSKELAVLSKACKLCMYRNQPIMALLLNAFCAFDLYCADKLIRWTYEHGKDFESDVSSLAAIEEMMSLSMVEIILDKTSKPEFVASDMKQSVFSGKEIYHPLIKPDKVVSNSITLNSKSALITGSNMSGKTTLIRTIGVLSLLSYAGAYVPASSLKLGRMRIMSSMRIVDSMKEEMSTFKAELVRISGIVKASKEDKPLLYLIDEIFRGTNSADRTDGARTVLNILNKPEIIGLMTTHDYALCDEAQKMDNMVFYYFSEEYTEDSIIFNYILREGVSHISNAKYLMKLVGIVI